MTTAERIEVAKKFLKNLEQAMGESRFSKSDPKIWNDSKKVRIYGLANRGYVAINEDGTISNEIRAPWVEIFEAIKMTAEELAAPAVAEAATEETATAVAEAEPVVETTTEETAEAEPVAEELASPETAETQARPVAAPTLDLKQEVEELFARYAAQQEEWDTSPMSQEEFKAIIERWSLAPAMLKEALNRSIPSINAYRSGRLAVPEEIAAKMRKIDRFFASL